MFEAVYLFDLLAVGIVLDSRLFFEIAKRMRASMFHAHGAVMNPGLTRVELLRLLTLEKNHSGQSGVPSPTVTRWPT